MPDLLLFDHPIAVVDVETTGSNVAYGDRVTELGIVRIERGEIVRTFSQLIDPKRPVSRGASRITGITDAMLAGQPTFDDVWPIARTLLSGAVIVGHNVAFDLAFLAGESRRARRGSLVDQLGDAPVIDTVKLARKTLGRGGNGLQNLSRRLGITPTTAHRALADCETTAAVLEALLLPRGGWTIPLSVACELQGKSIRLSRCVSYRSTLPELITEALLCSDRVCIEYLDANDVASRRDITPTAVRRWQGQLTLVAHCHTRNERRMFRVDRIARVSQADLLFAV